MRAAPSCASTTTAPATRPATSGSRTGSPRGARSVALGVDELRRIGHDDIVLIGLRLGATLALLDALELRATRVVAWAPVVSGRRYVREIRMLGLAVEPSEVCPDPDGAITVGGTVLDAATLGDLTALDLEKLEASPARSVLLIERPDRPPLAKLAGRLGELGCDVETRAIEGSEQCLDEPTEYATVPEEVVHAITEWVAADPPPERDDADHEPRERAALAWEGATITETVETFTARGLVGIVGIAADAPADGARATVVWTNPGSETHIGPGRAWVEYSRTLNRLGYRTIRLDCRGWGESPDDDHAPGRPYDAHMADDLRDLAADLEARGWGPVVIFGLCAGAWIALDLARTTPLGGVIASNPQLYWRPGDIVEANIATETHVRREAERERIKRLDRWQLWSVLDLLGARNPAARCLADIAARKTPTLLLFAPRDDGLEYLEDRLGRRLARLPKGPIRVVELESIDHGMHRAWLRHEVLDAIVDFLDTATPARPTP